MADVTLYLKQAAEKGASDLFIVAGAPVSFKVGGKLLAEDGNKLLPPDTKDLISRIYELAERDISRYLETGDDDFSFALPGIARFRVSAYRQRGSCTYKQRCCRGS